MAAKKRAALELADDVRRELRVVSHLPLWKPTTSAMSRLNHDRALSERLAQEVEQFVRVQPARRVGAFE